MKKVNCLIIKKCVFVPSEEAGDGFRHKLRKDASHLPKPTRPGFKGQINLVGISKYLKSIFDRPPMWELVQKEQ